MINYDPKRLLISLHIPKTAGNSFEYVLKNSYGLGYFRHYYNHSKDRKPARIPWVNTLQKIVPLCIHGHFDPEEGGVNVFDYYPEAAQFITVVRDPLEMHLSLYFYMRKLFNEGALSWKGKPSTTFEYKDIDHWVEERPFYMLRFFPFELNHNNYADMLNDNFIHLVVAEHMESSMEMLSKRLSRKLKKVPVINTTPRNEQPSEKSIQIFREKYPLEHKIYKFALDLNKLSD